MQVTASDPQCRDFLAALTTATTLDEAAFVYWSRTQSHQLSIEFAKSDTPNDECGAWLRERFAAERLRR
jgi:hypothetical protein